MWKGKSCFKGSTEIQPSVLAGYIGTNLLKQAVLNFRSEQTQYTSVSQLTAWELCSSGLLRRQHW
jgi:hypothetical protein